MNLYFRLIAVMAAAALAACGGGSTPASPPVHVPPVVEPPVVSPPPVLPPVLPVAPSIAKSPDNLTVASGGSATLYVHSTGDQPMSYQWQRNGVDIPGATNYFYQVDNVTEADNATQWRAVVRNPSGSAVSAPATITAVANAGTISVFAGKPHPVMSPADNPLLSELDGIAIDSNGHFLVADTFGFKSISAAHEVKDVIGKTRREPLPGSCYRSNVAADRAGNTVWVDTCADTVHTLLASAPGVDISYDGVGKYSPGSSEGIGGSADFRFKQPSAALLGTDGTLYVSDTGNYVIRKISPTGGGSVVAGAAGSRGFMDGAGGTARFTELQGLAIDAAGNLYVGDGGTVRRIAANGVVTTLAGSVGERGSADGKGSSARFGSVGNLAVDGAGNVIVADTLNRSIRKVAPDGNVTTISGKFGTIDVARDGAPSTASYLEPTGVAIGPAGTIYVSDRDYGIRALEADGNLKTELRMSSVGTYWGYADDVGTRARMLSIWAMAIDASDNLYLADAANQAIRKVSPSAQVTTVYKAPVIEPTSGPPYSFVPASLAVDAAGTLHASNFNFSDSPIVRIGAGGEPVKEWTNNTGFEGVEIAIGLADSLYAMLYRSNPGWSRPGAQAIDCSKIALGKLGADGQMKVIAGSLTESGGYLDGPGASARFGAEARDLAADRLGNVYFSDPVNRVIRKLSPDGMVSTLAGSAGQTGVVDGKGASARFYWPGPLAVGRDGNIFVADYGTLRRITPDGVVNTVAGSTASAHELTGRAGALGHDVTGIVADSKGNIYVATRTAVLKIVFP